MTQAFVILDCAGRVRWSNRAADVAFKRREGIALSGDGRLVIAIAAARMAFQQALRQCLCEGPRMDGQPLVIVPRQGGLPFTLGFQALPDDFLDGMALVLLTIGDPEAQAPAQLQMLRDVYGLSPTEARLVQALAEGVSLREFSARHQMSYETVRSHTRRVLHKTGARRQADLVRIAHRLR
jgi:DNA-binding CsgD family transcriptional regulator